MSSPTGGFPPATRAPGVPATRGVGVPATRALLVLVTALAAAVLGLAVPPVARAQDSLPIGPAAPAAPAPGAPASDAPASGATRGTPPGGFVPLQAARLYDSRDAARVVDHGFAAPASPLGPGQTVGVPVAGRGGVPDSGAGTVVLNVTGTRLFGSSLLTVWPQGAPRPPAATLAFGPQPVSTTVVSKLGDGGAVSLSNLTGLSDATVDVVGWFPEGSPMSSGVPRRILDTRPATPDAPGATPGGSTTADPLRAGQTRTVRVGAPGLVPGSTVLLGLTGAGATAPTGLRVWPAGSARPAAPALVLGPGETVPTTTVVPVGPDGAVDVAPDAGAVDVAMDVIAVMPPSVGRSLAPARLFDSHGTGPLVPGATRRVPVLGRSGVPATGVSSVLLTVTGTAGSGPGAVGVWGDGPPPATSAVVAPAGSGRAGFAVVPVAPDGTIAVAVAGAPTDVALDVVGWLAGTPKAVPGSPLAPGAPLPTTPPGTPTTLPGMAAPGLPVPALPGTSTPPADGGSLLWQADYARGLANYLSAPWNFQGAPAPQVTSLGGRPALAVTMPGGGQRAELEPNFRSLRSGDDLYFGFSVTLAPGFPADTDDWQVITQWKNDGTGSPPVSVKVGKGQFQLDGGFDRGAPFQLPMGAATVGRPHQVVVHIAFAQGGGQVDTWVDGQQTIRGFRPPAGTLYSGTSSYLKTGIYRNTAISQPGTLYFDDWRIGTSYGAAAPR